MVAYYSKKLPEAVQRYSISKLELTDIMAMLQHLHICLEMLTVRYRVPEFPHSSATFNIILGSHILASPEVLQGALADSTCPT